MTQSGAKRRRGETRPLNERKDFHERDTLRESSGAFIMLVERYNIFRSRGKQRCFIILDTFKSSIIMLLCAVFTYLIKHTIY